MTPEKEVINARALSGHIRDLVTPSETLTKATKAVTAFFVDPEAKENVVAVRQNAANIHELFRTIADYSAALDELKKRAEFAIVSIIDESPELQACFKIQAGAKSIKCDYDKNSMRNLMDKFKELGYDPCALFEKCSAITAKKAADAFGLSEQVFLETYGDLFQTHQNKPSVKMTY